MSFVLNEAQLQQLFRSPNGPVYQEINRITTGVWNASRAMGNVPVDKGRLKESMAMEIRIENNGIVGVVGTVTEYAVYVHQGTRRSRANPWLIRALEMNGLKPKRGLVSRIFGR